jgi:polyribonucleotide nucleotidyltransferase
MQKTRENENDMASKKKADDSQTHAGRSRTRKPMARERRQHDGDEGAAPGAGTGTAPQPSGRVVVERQIGGRTLTLETGRMAKLSDGACVARYGDTMVLATVNSAKAPEGIDFFPLTVDYREKTSAAGVIPGGFFKREGRPTTKEILACRIIDRSIRPMFPDGFRREVQVLSQVLSTDRENDPDVLAAIASFAALALSSVPHGRSLGMVRIGYADKKLVVNPLWTELQSDANRLNLTVAGHQDAIVMVEAGAKEIGEDVMLQALELAHETCRQIADMVDELAAKAGKPKMAFTPPRRDPELVAAIEDEFGAELRKAPLLPGTKQVRSAATKAVKEKAAKKFHAPTSATPEEQKVWNTTVSEILGDIVKDAERQSILRGVRADGRDHTTVRPITIEVGVLPRVHGSVLFTRGETQALGVVTLGGTDDQQIIDGLMPEPKKRFLLHYSFPPFSVGEVKRVLAPGRREIGHGALAERGLEAVLPSREEFPYTIRITSEILESNGSSSMATACAGTLAMMDAGVPIKQPVAGIAMGLVMEGRKYAILTDILGSEDACGDMDFKVVGTQHGITALQMDIKCDGLTRQIMAEALEQAREGRLHVLREMLKALARPRADLSPNAPRLESLQVPNDKIGMIIGPGGKNIRAMQETYECKISIEDGGLCTITGLNSEKVKACVAHIKAMTAEVELGSIYEGRVTAIKEFGAFVEILPGQEGLVHVSELSDGFIRAVTDVVRIGDTLKVKVIAIDDFGKIKLSRKAVLLAERGGAAGEGAPPPRAERSERPAGGEPFERGERREREGRPERAEPTARPAREERGDRWERGGREDRGDRWDRGEGERRPRQEAGERQERPHRGDQRPERSFESRPYHGERRGADERGARGEREGRGEPVGERPRAERLPREREDRRPYAGDLDRADRPERLDRPDRFERPARDDRRPAGGQPDVRGGRGHGDRPERIDRPERQERVHSDRREERAPREGGERSTTHGWRERREEPMERGDRRPFRDAAAPVRQPGPPAGGEQRPRHERPERLDRPQRPGRFDRDDVVEHPGRPSQPGPAGAPRRSGEARPPRPDLGGRSDRLEQPERTDRRDQERMERRERPERGERREPRSRMPMAEFEDEEREPAPTPRDVGQLESLDSVLGEDRGPRRDRRRRRD